MLQKIRDNATSGFAFIMLGLLILAFAVWGIDFQFGGSQVIVEVDGEEVPSYQIVNAYNQQIQQFQQFYPNGIPELQQEQLKQRVVESFVRNQLLLSHTTGAGYGMPDDKVRDAIRSTPGFQVDGKFNAASFEYAANRGGFSPEGLYNEFRQSLVMQQLAQGLTETAFVTKEDIRTRGALERETRTVRTVRIAASDLLDEVEIDPAEVQSTYEFNQAEYMTEEKVRLDYIELDPEKIADTFEIDDGELQDRYTAGVETGEFSRPETRNGRHILIAVDADTTEEQARTEAEALRERIMAGEDFAELAKEFSDDAGSKPQGGELGWNTRDAYVGPFADAMFSMAVDDVSEPIKTRYGFHIIRLEGVRGNENQPFEEVRDQLVEELKNDRARAELTELMSELDELVYDVDDSLADAAAAAGVEIQQSDWITRSGG
ncbi:MAG: hypothetical protein HKN70_10795, partial [Gammaproteobacteria bacterium]|nr:hypothetical protein [Gammaproteobacteria bacterium]